MAEESEMDDARKRYDFKKTLEKLQAQQGDGTELITLYIPPDKPFETYRRIAMERGKI